MPAGQELNIIGAGRIFHFGSRIGRGCWLWLYFEHYTYGTAYTHFCFVVGSSRV